MRRVVFTVMLVLLASTICAAANVTISFMEVSNAAKQAAFQEYYKIWTSKNPQVKVEYFPLGYGESFDKIKTLYAAGDPYDVSPMYSPRYDSSFALGNALLPLDNLVQRDKIREQDFLPGIFKAWDQFSNGQRIALPYAFTGSLLWYNPDLFDTAGLPYPPTSWEDTKWTWRVFVDAAKKMTRDTNGDGIPEVWGLATIPPMTIVPLMWDQELFNADFTEFILGSQAGAETIQRAADLALVDRVAPKPGAVTGEQFPIGQAAMEFRGAWTMSNARSWNIKWNWAVPPIGAKRVTTMNVDHLYIAKGNTNQEAFEWVKFLATNPEAQLIYAGKGNGKIPALTQAAYEWVKGDLSKLYPGLNLNVLMDGLKYDVAARTGEAFPNWAKVSPILNNAYVRICTGQASAYQVLNEISGPINAILKEYKR